MTRGSIFRVCILPLILSVTGTSPGPTTPAAEPSVGGSGRASTTRSARRAPADAATLAMPAPLMKLRRERSAPLFLVLGSLAGSLAREPSGFPLLFGRGLSSLDDMNAPPAKCEMGNIRKEPRCEPSLTSRSNHLQAL